MQGALEQLNQPGLDRGGLKALMEGVRDSVRTARHGDHHETAGGEKMARIVEGLKGKVHQAQKNVRGPRDNHIVAGKKAAAAEAGEGGAAEGAAGGR